MRSDRRPMLLAGLVLAMALGTPLSAHADGTATLDPSASQPPGAQAPAGDDVVPVDQPPAEVPADNGADQQPQDPPALDPPAADPPVADPPVEVPDDGRPAGESPHDSPGVTLDNAQLRWSLNPLLHRAPHYGKNFLSAGLLADTAGSEMPAGSWRQSEGRVRIERASGASYVPATWDGFGDGTDHQVVIDGGTGTVDAAAGTARIAWQGSFGVARYSGMTAFSVSDPVLVVENGVGRLEASLGGFGVARDGNGAGSAGGPIGPTTVVLADLGGVDLSKPAGLTSVPVFYGLRGVHAAQKADPQGRWGSFPPTFIDFVDQVGQAPFWMTSGSDDEHKAGSPVAVSFDAAAPLAATPPPVSREVKRPDVSNPTRTAPSPRGPAAVPAQPPLVPLAAPPLTAPPAAEPVAAAFGSTSLTGARPVLAGPDGDADLGWWIAAAFLLMSAAAVTTPSLLVRPRAA